MTNALQNNRFLKLEEGEETYYSSEAQSGKPLLQICIDSEPECQTIEDLDKKYDLNEWKL